MLNFAPTVSVFTVFLQGLLSFFSPCVLPLVPLYLSYLAGGAKKVAEDGTTQYQKGKVMLRTLCFVLGISFSFFVMGLGVTALGSFFNDNRMIFARVGGVVVILFGLYQLGLFGTSKTLSQEHRLPFRLDRLAMNPFTAFLLGFIFSFAWTPCVGPALTSVLLIAGSAKTMGYGFFLLGIYTLGFVLPFLAVGLFTGKMLELFRRHQKALGYTVKIGGALLVLMGIMMVTGWMNSFTGYLSPAQPSETPPPASSQSESAPAPDSAPKPQEEAPDNIPAPDFTLTDQYGNTHTLSDYKGKVIFLNFWATWCAPCRSEMPDIQALYEKYGENSEDVIVLGVIRPNTGMPGDKEKTEEEIAAYLKDEGYTYPSVMDSTGAAFGPYGITAYPTTFMIDKEGNLLGYVRGAITMEMMESIVQQALDGTL